MNKKEENISTSMATKDRVLLGVDPEDLDAASIALKDRWLAIFIQLARSHRFLTFIEKNYAIQDIVNEEERTIETLVVESPLAIGPPLNSTQMIEIQNVIKLSNCTNPDQVFERIMKLLGQESSKLIIP